MLEVRKNTYARNFENFFFREFARHLSESFKNDGRSGLLIGSPFCEVDERLQIDALLITQHVVCIIDFKNFSGQIHLPGEESFESGIWTNQDGKQIKGGSYINPFAQLKHQKRRFTEVFSRHIKRKLYKEDLFNPFHSVRIVCFQEEIQIYGRIPPAESLNFFILDKIRFLEGIRDIIDVHDTDVNISEHSYAAFKKVFKAGHFKVDEKPLEDKLKAFAEKSNDLDYTILRQDQSIALSAIRDFLVDAERHVFILQGTANSGKSFLIPYIQEIAYQSGIQETEVFAPFTRVANNLRSAINVKNIHSIYTYIYGGLKNDSEEDEEKDEIDAESNENESEITMDVIPLKRCDNADNALFIIDEAHLVSDSYHQSVDLIFGSGYLLKDFLEFTDALISGRKIIFIGDPYQLHMGKADESPLNPTWLSSTYKLHTNICQLLDNEDYSDINRQALRCVNAIRDHLFSSLKFEENSGVHFLGNTDVLTSISDLVNRRAGHILGFSNEDAQKVNHWIKRNILNNGEDIAPGDLCLLNRTIVVQGNDPFAVPTKLYNGQFVNVTNAASPPTEEIINVRHQPISLKFREIKIQAVESGLHAEILVLENYRVSLRAELSNDEIVALRILLNIQLSGEIKLHPFEQSEEYTKATQSTIYAKLQDELKALEKRFSEGEEVKGKVEEKQKEIRKLLRSAKKNYRLQFEVRLRQDPSSKYARYKNAALIRFGWAMTVHKSMSYTWKEILFNVEPGANIGKKNEQYFRWIYTGISRAELNVSLINYKPISPLSHTEIVDRHGPARQHQYFHTGEKPGSQLDELKDLVTGKLTGSDIKIERVESLNWQERYHLYQNSKKTIISFGYNGEYKFKYPTLMGGDRELGKLIIELLSDVSSAFDFTRISDIWRRCQYQALANELAGFNIIFSQIIQKSYKDQIKLKDTDHELDVDVDYNNEGSFSYITARYYSDPEIWNRLIEVVGKMKIGT